MQVLFRLVEKLGKVDLLSNICFFFCENMTSFLNHVTATLRAVFCVARVMSSHFYALPRASSTSCLYFVMKTAFDSSASEPHHASNWNDVILLVYDTKTRIL